VNNGTEVLRRQLVIGGVRVFFYLEDRERSLNSPTDQIMLSLTAFADGLEREKTRERRHDAMNRKPRAGQVAGGRVFGYDNVEMIGAAAIDRTSCAASMMPNRRSCGAFSNSSAAGYGMKAIAKTLNAAGAPSSPAQQARSQTGADGDPPGAVSGFVLGRADAEPYAEAESMGQQHQAARQPLTGNP
jgi:hypothetical protein